MLLLEKIEKTLVLNFVHQLAACFQPQPQHWVPPSRQSDFPKWHGEGEGDHGSSKAGSSHENRMLRRLELLEILMHLLGPGSSYIV